MNSEPPSDSQYSRDVLDCLRRIVSALRISNRAAESRFKMSAAQLFVLHQLADEEALSVNDLARKTLTHQSSVSVVVSRLVDRKLVMRKRGEKDGRQRLLSITAAGRAVLRKSPLLAQQRIVEALASMPASQRIGLAELLHSLVKRAGFSEASPSLFFEDKPGKSKTKHESPRS